MDLYMKQKQNHGEQRTDWWLLWGGSWGRGGMGGWGSQM